jgi:predicted PurR-regulated permease PerM
VPVLCYTLFMNENLTKRFFFLALFLAALAVVLLMLWPFFTVILLSLSLTAVFYPIHRWLRKKTKVNWVSALLTVLLFIIILCIPLLAIGSVVLAQSENLYNWVVQNGGIDTIISSLNKVFTRFGIDPAELRESITAVVGNISRGIGTIFSAALTTIFSLLLVALTMFYLLKDGAHWKQMLVKLSPLSDEGSEVIIRKLVLAANGIIKGYLLIALIQGALMGIGMYIFGVPHAALWGVLAGIASLVPTIGTALVSVPTIIFLAIMDRSGAALGFALWAGVLVGAVDNLLNPIIVGRTIHLHPLLVLFAVLGGMAFMGPVGILIGPLVVSFMYALMSVYKNEMSS